MHSRSALAVLSSLPPLSLQLSHSPIPRKDDRTKTEHYWQMGGGKGKAHVAAGDGILECRLALQHVLCLLLRQLCTLTGQVLISSVSS
eukprot:369275-Rhodomonas_salina.2